MESKIGFKLFCRIEFRIQKLCPILFDGRVLADQFDVTAIVSYAAFSILFDAVRYCLMPLVAGI